MKKRSQWAFDPKQFISLTLAAGDNGGNDRYQQCAVHKSEGGDGCPYRSIDWADAIGKAEDVMKVLPAEDVSINSTVEARFDALFPGCEESLREAALSILTDPIEVNHSLILGNGRHRICAMQFQRILVAPACQSSGY